MRSSTASRSSSSVPEAASARWTSLRSLRRPADSRSAAAISSEAERRTIVSDELVLTLSSLLGRDTEPSAPSIVITVSESFTRSPALTRPGTARGRPLSRVVLREPRSSTIQASPSR